MRYYHEDKAYKPITPQPDTDELAMIGPRLMMKHTKNGIVIFWAMGTITAGWVIGLSYSDFVA